MHPRRYTAFISYRHADNTQEGRRWAEWLHRALERYVVPPDLIGTPNLRGEPIRDSLYPIFRDEDELPANADLATGIRAALEVSDHLIVLCSPRSAVSPWVRREVREFKELGRSDRILTVIIAGEPNTDDPAKSREGILPDEECFCEELRFGAVRENGSLDWTIRTEPLAADLRPSGARAEGYVTAEAYREHLMLSSNLSAEKITTHTEAYRRQLDHALLKIIAGLVGVPLGQLKDRDAAHRAELARKELLRAEAEATRLRTFNRRLKIAAAIVLFLAGAASLFWWWAGVERDRAEEAMHETRNTLSQSDYLQACRFLREENVPVAIAYLSRSLRTNPRNPSARTALLALLTYNNHPKLLWTRLHSSVPRVIRSENARFAVGLTDGSVSILSLPQGLPIGIQLPTPDKDERDSLWNDYGVNDLAFSPNGKRLATAAQDNRVRVWDLETGKRLILQDHAALLAKYVPSIFSVRFNPSGTFLATAGIDGCGLILDASRGEFPQAWRERFDTFAGPNRSVEFAPDGAMVAAATKRGMSVWQIGTAQPLMEYEADVNTVAFSHDSSKVIAACGDGTARVFDPKSGQELLGPLRHFAPVEKAHFSPNGSLIFTTCSDGSAWLWHSDTGEHASGKFGHSRPLSAAEFSASGRLILTASADGTARLWDTVHTGATFLPASHSQPLTCATFSGRDSLILTTSTDGRTRLWEIGCNSTLPVLLPHRSGVATACVSPDGSLVATVTDDNHVTIWNSVTGQEQCKLRVQAPVCAITFSADGHRVRIVKEEGDVVEWDAFNGGDMLKIYRLPGRVRIARFSPDRKSLFVLASEGDLAHFDADTGALRRKYSRSGEVKQIAIGPDSNQAVLTLDGESKASRIDLNTGQDLEGLAPWDKATLFTFNRDGRLLAGVSGNTVLIWDVATSHLRTRITSERPISHVSFTPDSETLFTSEDGDGSWNGHLWDVATGQPHPAKFRHHASISHVEFSDDGKRLLTTSKDGYARLWSYLPIEEECPSWLLQLSETIGGYVLDGQGTIEASPEASSETIARIANLVKNTSGTSEITLWGRWFFQDRAQRPVGPHVTFLLNNYVDVLLEAGTAADIEDAAMAALGLNKFDQMIRNQ